MTDLYPNNLTRNYGDGSGSKYQAPAKTPSDYLMEIAALKVELEKAEKKIETTNPKWKPSYFQFPDSWVQFKTRL